MDTNGTWNVVKHAVPDEHHQERHAIGHEDSPIVAHLVGVGAHLRGHHMAPSPFR
jgi:hypothetical protein